MGGPRGDSERGERSTWSKPPRDGERRPAPKPRGDFESRDRKPWGKPPGDRKPGESRRGDRKPWGKPRADGDTRERKPWGKPQATANPGESHATPKRVASDRPGGRPATSQTAAIANRGAKAQGTGEPSDWTARRNRQAPEPFGPGGRRPGSRGPGSRGPGARGPGARGPGGRGPGGAPRGRGPKKPRGDGDRARRAVPPEGRG